MPIRRCNIPRVASDRQEKTLLQLHKPTNIASDFAPPRQSPAQEAVVRQIGVRVRSNVVRELGPGVRLKVFPRPTEQSMS